MKAADQTRVHFVDVASASADRDACRPTGQRWIEPFNGAINADPVHPNAAGETAMATQTLSHLGIDDA